MEKVFKHRKTGELAYYKDGIFKQDKEFFINFVAERESKKDYIDLIYNTKPE